LKHPLPTGLLPTRRLPEHPDLSQLKRQAKELLDGFLNGQERAVVEVQRLYRDADRAKFALHDAQLALARGYGFESWPKLKAHVDGVTVERLGKAVRANDLEQVRAILRVRPELVNVVAAWNNEHTALHYAVLDRMPEMVRLLMRHGANARAGISPRNDATSAMSIKCLRRALVLGLLLPAQTATAAQARVEKNVVYGMYSGTALLLNVHYPARPNGFGIVFIPGSGWGAPLRYSATPLKESSQVGVYVPSLTEAGYTVFAITHRAIPTFRYPAALEDVQRAVRFVRHLAAKYGVNPARISGSGWSSGGHLVSMLGTMDGIGDLDDPDPVNRESAKLQSVAVSRSQAFRGSRADSNPLR
jgi:BD-FAE/Ankyrin repeat